METKANEALHQVATAIKDVVEGYDTLEDRAEAEILPTIRKLKEMHARHFSEISGRLGALGDPAGDEASIRGTVNKAMVAMRDWVSTLDADALSFVREGEEKLIGIYDDALEDSDRRADLETSGLLTTQRQQIAARKDLLPAS